MEPFDWVTTRSSCSLGVVFGKLKADVETDVQTRQRLRPENAHYGFRFSSASTKSFSVVAEGNKIHCEVEFTLRDGAIHVEGSGFDGKPSFDVVLTLNDQGECRAKIKDEEREFWQVRKKALEALFFSSY